MKKKKNEKLKKRQIVILVITTLVLGIICYLLATEITKSVIDKKAMEEKMKKEDFSDLTKLVSLENISFDDYVNKYNEIINNDDLKINNTVDNSITINENDITFYLDDDNNVTISKVDFKKKNNTAKNIIIGLIQANNEAVDKKTAKMIYDKVFETLGNTKDDDSKTSEFFQYQGIECSLKYYKKEKLYSFRIGRIID